MLTFHVLYVYYSSDIDLVIIGQWDKLPLRTLEHKLVTEGIADQATIKVLEKASVSTALQFQFIHIVHKYICLRIFLALKLQFRFCTLS